MQLVEKVCQLHQNLREIASEKDLCMVETISLTADPILGNTYFFARQ